MKELILLVHPMLGMIGIVGAVWAIVETLNASQSNLFRIKIASFVVAVSMFFTWIASGIFYVTYYAADKAIILKGPWPFAHSFFMESKEHLFFITLVLSLLLPIIAQMKNIVSSKQTRILFVVVASLIIASGMAIEP
jgi:hypothetical protein